MIFDWDGTAVPDRRGDASNVRELIEEGCGLGLHLGIVSGTHIGNVDGRLRARPQGPGSLHLLLNRGSEVYSVAADGPRLLWRRTATPAEDTALSRTAECVRARLRERGLMAQVVVDRLNRRKINLIPEPEWAEPPKARIGELLAAVEVRLRACGIDGLHEVVDIAAATAREEGLTQARVTTDAKYVEIGLTDKADSSRWFFAELWRRGIGPALVLVAGDEMGPIGGVPGSDSRLLAVAAAERAAKVSVGIEPGGVPAGVHLLGGGSDRLAGLLAMQLARRRRRAVPALDRDPAWSLRISGVDRTLERVHETLLTIADGQIGTKGTPLGRHPATTPLVLASGVYAGEGVDSELTRCPAWNELDFDLGAGAVERTLDLHTGMLRCELNTDQGGIEAMLFSSLARPGTTALRAAGPRALLEGGEPLPLPADRAWRRGHAGKRGWLQARFGRGGVAIAAGERVGGGQTTATLDRTSVYCANAERVPAPDEALARLDEGEAAGFERLLAEHRAAWAERWEDADVRVEGDNRLQLAIRFALFHLMASAGDGPEAAIGARGLSGTAYKGHVFWDACVFVLPFLAATHPESARAMLEYRAKRLPAALAIARRAGRRGARFPWESAASGEDVTPGSALSRAGGRLPVRTGELAEHIVADVAWGVRCYVDWSGDLAFLQAEGGRLVAETARYWASRVERDQRGRAHIRNVMGPDEYHPHVDDNAFTNVMARWNLRYAARLPEGAPAAPSAPERADWLAIAEALVDGLDPETGVYEQFAGFSELEPLVIAELAPRRPIAADLLLGRSRVESAQIVKQADALMLHQLVPEEVAPGSLTPNLAFYEPRTAHGSSLSPGIHAALLARAGRLEDACEALDLTARIDLDDVSETTAGGLHLAAMGSVWQAVALGFAGLRPRGDALEIAPNLPPRWPALGLRIRFRGTRLRLEIRHDQIEVDPDAPLKIILPERASRTVGPAGATIEYDRREASGAR
jgi:trehalose/maltose hydrolase-like predicted phosphorylase